MLTVRLPPELIDAVQAAAKAQGSGRSEIIRYILRDWLTAHGYLRHREDPEGAN